MTNCIILIPEKNIKCLIGIFGNVYNQFFSAVDRVNIVSELKRIILIGQSSKNPVSR